MDQSYSHNITTIITTTTNITIITIINPDPLNESLITMVTGEAEVKRKASCVGGVEGKPKLARTRIASSLVDAPAHQKNKMKYSHKTA